MRAILTISAVLKAVPVNAAGAFFFGGLFRTGVPVVNGATFAVATPDSLGETVGTVTASNNPTLFAITAGNSAGNFAISNVGVITVTSAGVNDLGTGTATLTVTASNASGASSGATVTINYSPSSGTLPSGVTLQAIDGETMTDSTTMTKNYFARNGYTAATNTAYNGTSWDSANFFPLMVYFGLYSGDLSYFRAMGFTITNNATAGSTSTISRNGIWYVMGGPGATAGTWQATSDGTSLTLTSNLSGGSINTNDWIYATDGTNTIPAGTTITTVVTNGGTGTYTMSAPATPGNLTSTVLYDAGGSNENPFGAFNPAIHSDESDITSFAHATPDAVLKNAGRFIDYTQTHNALSSGSIGSPVNRSFADLLSANALTTPAGNTVSVGAFSIDFYWFAAQAVAGLRAQAADFLRLRTVTQDQMRRGSNYGNMIDCFRSWGNGSNSVGVSGMAGTSGKTSRLPFWALPENSNGLLGGQNIQPYEMNWAIWSSIIHGARGVIYFAYSQDHGAGFTNPRRSGGTYSQAITTNALINALAPILNSPFALNYATVSPAGYLFPTPQSNWFNGGVELCAHWYQGGAYTISNTAYGSGPMTFPNGFYIIATTRESESVTNISATFTINDPKATSVNVVGESRSINIVGGQFTDTFANSYTVHIYQVIG